MSKFMELTAASRPRQVARVWVRKSAVTQVGYNDDYSTYILIEGNSYQFNIQEDAAMIVAQLENEEDE